MSGDIEGAGWLLVLLVTALWGIVFGRLLVDVWKRRRGLRRMLTYKGRHRTSVAAMATEKR